MDNWGSEEVAAWLEALDLGEYKEVFMRHDIQGCELILLERRDLKVLIPWRAPDPPLPLQLLAGGGNGRTDSRAVLARCVLLLS